MLKRQLHRSNSKLLCKIIPFNMGILPTAQRQIRREIRIGSTKKNKIFFEQEISLLSYSENIKLTIYNKLVRN